MSPGLFVLVLCGIVASSVVLGWMGLLVFRELQSALDFDRRLGVPRTQALSFGLWVEHRAQNPGGGGREARALVLALIRIGSMLVPVGAAEREKLAALLRQAGFAQRDALSYFLSAKLACAALIGAGTGFQAAESQMLGAHTFIVAFVTLAGLIIGGILPEYAVRAIVSRRLSRMARALPDALDLMVMCLESGLTFERGLLTVATELAPIEANLAGEFRQMEAELRVGSDRRAVLQEFYRRTDIDGLRDMAMTLIQSDRFGTPLTQAMKNIAASERTQRAAQVEARTERLPVLMTIPMLLFVVPGTLLLVAGPAFLTAVEAIGAVSGQ